MGRTSRGRFNSLFLAFLLSAFCAAAVRLLAQEPGAQVDEQLAQLYLDHAATAYEAGRQAEAYELAGQSLSLSGRNSDALYLLGLCDSPALSPDFSLRSSRIARYQAALSQDSFRVFNAQDCLFALSESLLQTRDYLGAESALREGRRDMGAALDLNPRASLIWIKTAFYLKKTAEYYRLLKSALSAFPQDSRFARFFLEHEYAERRSPEARACLEMVKKRLESHINLDREFLVLYSAFAYDSQEATLLMRRYRSGGSSSRLGSERSLRLGIAPEAEILEEFWAASNTAALDYTQLRRFFDLLSQESSRTAFIRRLASLSADIVTDENQDGFPETRAGFISGELVKWEEDSDQDGRAEMVVHFENALPRSISAQYQDQSLLFSYWSYPELESAQVLGAQSSSRYSFGASSFSLPLLRFNLPFLDEGLKSFRRVSRDFAFALPSPDAMLLRANSLEESLTPGEDGVPLRRITRLESGIPLLSEEFEGQRPLSKREYRKGIPQREWLSYNDVDGRWQGRLDYEASDAVPYYRKKTLSMDYDGDGLPEYREVYQPRLVKEWDFDGNASFDVSEEEGVDRLILTFSSKLDGMRDVRIELVSGKIDLVKKNGKTLRLGKESGADLYWIGRQPFNLGPRLPERDGIHLIDGLRILFYRSGKLAFAEVVE